MKRVVPNVVLGSLLLGCTWPAAMAQVQAAVNGTVRDAHGDPQMGALVELLAGDAVVAQTFTDDHGQYRLPAIPPGRYGLRASSVLSLPVIRPDIQLVAGSQVLANLTMTAIYEVGLWFPAERRTAAESPNDWRWTLRSSANRPLLRLDGGLEHAGVEGNSADNDAEASSERVPHFTLSTLAHAGGLDAKGMHTALHVERPRLLPGFGESSLAVAMDASDARQGGSPAVDLSTGFHTANGEGSGMVMVAAAQTEPQLLAPGSRGAQRLSLASGKELTVGPVLFLDAGTVLTAEKLASVASVATPYLRIVVAPRAGLTLMYRLATDPAAQSSDDLGREQSPALLSDAAGRPILLRELHQELAVSYVAGQETATVMVYQDALPFDAVNGTGRLSAGTLQGMPAVENPETGDFRIATAGYRSRGLSASWTRAFGQEITVSGIADCGTALVRDDQPMVLAALGSSTHPATAEALTGRVQGKLARSGTSFAVSYRWQSDRTLDSVDAFNADRSAFLSLSGRQRLWAGHGLSSIQVMVDATNLLEQGYQPVLAPDGEMVFVAPAVRTLQAGLSFTF